MTAPEQVRPRAVASLADDELGAATISVVISELEWTPDVAPAVVDRLGRDAVAYPEHLDRRASPAHPPRRGRGGGAPPRALGRLLALGAIVVVVVIVSALLLSQTGALGAAPDPLRIELVPVASGFDQPVLVTGSGDGSGDLYVVEQPGRILVIAPDGTMAPEPFLDISERVVSGGERGLLGLAFHPGFAENGRLFVDYTRVPDGATVVSELHAQDRVADPGSERPLLVIEQPFENHNGGNVAFDASGYLLVGMGDGGGGGDPLGSGQDPGTLLGKLLRLDVDGGEPYGIPPDNGFAGDPAFRPEIHVMGLRNPWRFSVDPVGGHIYIGDVGQDTWEEIDVLPDGQGGISLGWNELEGRECFVRRCDPGAHVPPAIVYGRDEGCTVIGGHVYRGADQPRLQGIYLFGDYCSGSIWGARADDLLAGRAEAMPLGTLDGILVSFGVDDRGESYVVDAAGRILRVTATASH